MSLIIAEKLIKEASQSSQSSQFSFIKALVKHLLIQLLSWHASNIDLLL